jgi:hypothetical protein
MAQASHLLSTNHPVTPDPSAYSHTSIVHAADAEFLAVVSGQAQRPISINVGENEIEDRADHLKTVLDATAIYLSSVLNDLAQNVPGSLDLHQIHALLSDLTDDILGVFQHAAEQIVGRRI